MAAPLIPLLAAGVGLATNASNMQQQTATNIQQQAFASYMYERQRKDALADWNMQNAYNAPAAQMQRLREAGLNPNLVYGKGADATAGAVRSSSQGQSSPRAPHFDPQAILLGLDVAIKQAQARSINADAANKEYELNWKENTEGTRFGILDRKWDKLQADVSFTIHENQRRDARNKVDIDNVIQDLIYKKEKLKQLPVQLSSLEYENEVKKLEAEFARDGIRPSDPLYVKGILALLTKIFGSNIWELLD